ncbi:MAG: hypothetical protein ACREQP_05910 [Candidatus Binatia bacterium]
MNRAGKITFILLVVLLYGCAGELKRVETAAGAEARAAEKERQEEKKDSAMPTFTYRP